jgi:hypothetical protein
VLIAGLILSSFPHDKISNNHHQRIKTIEKIPAARTKIEIPTKTNSPKSNFSQRIEFPVSKAFTISISINLLILI